MPTRGERLFPVPGFWFLVRWIRSQNFFIHPFPSSNQKPQPVSFFSRAHAFSASTVLLVTLLTLAASTTHATYTYSRAITISSANVSTVNGTDLQNFPVLISTTNISLSTITASGGHVANSTGYDLVFSTKSDCSYLLNWDTETYNATTGNLIAWVKVPLLDTTTITAATLYMCYGNSGVTTYQGNSTGTWDSNFAGVWHLPNGTTLTANDSTSNGNNGTLTNTPTATTGQIDGGMHTVAGSSQYASLATAASLNITGDITLECWIKTATNASIMFGGYQNISFTGYALAIGEGVSGKISFWSNGFGWTNGTTATVDDNNWHLIVVSLSGSTAHFYLDGSSDGTAASGAPGSYSGLRMIGGSEAGTGYYTGDTDEVRVSNTSRSADWIKTEYNNQSSPSTFISVGSEVTTCNQVGDWYNTCWAYREKITIDHTKVGTVNNTDQIDFPVLISTTEAALKYTGSGGHVGNADGTDILFTNADGITKYNHEIETYTATTGGLIAWVRVSTISHTSDTLLYMYYGNAGASDQQNKTGTWDGNFKGVWHLPDGTNLTANDSTSNGNGTLVNTPTATAGQIDGGAHFVASSNQDITVSAISSLGSAQKATLSGWAKRTTSSDAVTWGQDPGNSQNRLNATVWTDGNVYFAAEANDSSYSSYALAGTGWHYIVLVYDGSQTGTARVIAYLDGVATALTYSGTPPASLGSSVSTFYMGNDISNIQTSNGNLDEVRLSLSVRSADWIATEYNNQSAPGTFFSVGSDMPLGIYSTKTGNWSDPTIWSNGVVPVSTNPVTISSGTTVTLDVTPVASTMSIATAGTLQLNGFNLVLGSTVTLTNSGTLVLVGTETVTPAPNNLTGSTVTYNSAGTSIILSTWTYQNLVINGSGGTFSPTGTLVVDGNWTTTAGTFNAGTNQVTFNGSSAQIVNNAGQAFGVLLDSNTSNGGLTFASSFTANALTINGSSLASAMTVYFQANSTFTITNFNLNGSSGKPVQIRSTTNGTYSYLNNISTNKVSYVDVKDNNAVAGNVIQAGSTSMNSGHNVNWNCASSSIIRVQYVHNYVGNTATFTSTNTAGNFIYVVASWSQAATPSISDTNNNSYVPFSILSVDSNITELQAWYAMNISSGANTVTLTGCTDDCGVTAIEYSGVATSGAFDVSDSSSSTTATTTPTSNSFSTTATDVIIAAWADELTGGVHSAGTNYSLVQTDLVHFDAQEDWTNANSQTTVASFNADSVQNWVLFTSAFKAAVQPTPANPFVAAVYPSTITVSWTSTPGTNGFEVDASTAATFTGILFSTSTTNTSATSLTVSSAANLSPNTTYYLRAGAISGATNYANTVPASTSTLTSLLISPQIYHTLISSTVVNWVAFSSGPGTNTSEGYELDASTASNFSGTLTSSVTYNVSLTTLTINGLEGDTTYYLRVGGLNWNGVVNYSSVGSTLAATSLPGYLVHNNVYSDATAYGTKRALARGSDGTLHAVYTKGGPPYNVYYAYSTDGGRTWTEEAITSTSSSYYQFGPAIALDAANNVHVVWFGTGWGTNTSAQNIEYRKRTAGVGGSWQTQESVSDINASQSYPSIAVDSLGNVHVTWPGYGWGTNTGWGNLEYRKRTASGWQAQESVTDINNGNQNTPSIAVDSADNVHLVWTGEGWVSNWLNENVEHRERTASGWQTQEAVTDVAYNQSNLSLAVDSADNLHVVWNGAGWGTNTGNSNIQYRQRTSGGWQTQEAVTDINHDQQNPSLALDSGDNVHAVWSGNGWGTNTTINNIQYRERISGVWQTQVGITDVSSTQADPILIWSRWPNDYGAIENRPNTGYALVWTALQGSLYQVRYYPSSNLAWDAANTDTTPPSAATNLAAQNPQSHSVDLTWTVAGDDGNTGNLVAGSKFAIQYSTWSGVSWSTASAQVVVATGPVTQGITATYTVGSLGAGTTYYFRLWTRDETSTNWSGLSNGTTAQTLVGAPLNIFPSAVYQSSMTLQWGPMSATGGFQADASTASDFTGTLYSSVTANGGSTTLAVGTSVALSANTTYYLRVGAIFSGTTYYANSVPASTSTLANAVSNPQIYGVFTSSIAANWVALSSGPGNGTAEGYELDIAQTSDFSGTLTSSNTLNVVLSTLTVSGLSSGTTWYARVGSLNWNGIYTYVNLGSTQTVSLPGYLVQTNPNVPSSAGNNRRALARGSDGTLHTVYLKGSSPNVYYAYSTDNGQTWTEEAVTASGSGQTFPAIAVDSANNVHVVWPGAGWGTNSVYTNIQYRKRTPAGGWQTQEAVTDVNAAQYGTPSIAVDSSGNIHVVWTGSGWGTNSTINNIQYRERTSGGWQTQEAVTDNPGAFFQGQFEPSLAVDSANNLHLVWWGEGWGSNTTSFNIEYRKRTPAGGWQTQESVTDLFNFVGQFSASVAVDSSDNVHVVWGGSGWGSNPAISNIEYRKRTSGGWQTQEAVTDTAGSFGQGERNPSVAIDASDNVHVVWYGEGWGTNTTINNIQYRERTSGGWQTQVGITDAAEIQQFPLLIWARWPNGWALTNRPNTGYALVWSARQNSTDQVRYFPSSNLTWDAATTPTVTSVSTATIQVTWPSLGGTTGFELDASTASDFTGTIFSATTNNTAATSLIVNAAATLAVDTTYYLRAGALYSGTTAYSTPLATSTLTDLVQNAQQYQVFSTSITANWTPLGAAQGYVLQASTFSDFNTIFASTQTASVTLSTLTVQGLTPGVAYYLRVSGVNWDGVAGNWVSVGSAGGDTAWVLDVNGKAWPINNLKTVPTLGTAVTGMSFGGPEAIAFTPDGNTAWVADLTGHEVWPINNLKTSPTLGTPVAGMGGPGDLAITPDGNTAWVVDSTGGKVWPINNLRSSPTLGTAFTGITYPSGIVITPDGNTAWVTDATTGKVWPINNLKTTPALGTAVTGMNSPYRIALTPDGNTAWVVDYLAAKAWPINNLKTSPALGTGISGMTYPLGIAISPDGNTAWVADYSGNRAFPINNLKTTPTLGTAVGGMSSPTNVAIMPMAVNSTLTGAISNGQITNVYVTSITANWTALSAGLGYRLEASTASDFSATAGSSVTADITQSTLTVTGLASNTTFYLRVSGLDPAGTYTWSVLGSTLTHMGAPANPALGTIGGKTIQVTWTLLGGTTGFDVEASTANDFTGTLITTVTTNTAAISLIDGAGAQALAFDTTYYLRVGALYSGTTLYSTTLSTDTWTDLVTPQIYQLLSTSVTVNWPALGVGEGYLLQASSVSDFSLITVSSQTPSIALSTLTLQGLTPAVDYYLRVGGVNRLGVVNWAYLGGPGGTTAWVVDSAGSEVWPINNITTTPTLGTAVTGLANVDAIAITPDGNTAWVVGNNKAIPINNLRTTPSSGTAVTGVGFNANGIAITPDGNTAWVTDSNIGGAAVRPINNLKTTPTLGTPVTGMETFATPTGIAITPDGNTAWVVDSFFGGRAWPINNLKTTPTLGTAVNGMSAPNTITITSDGNTAWVADFNGYTWPINNLQTSPTLGTHVLITGNPEGVALTPDGNTAWVAAVNGGKAWPIHNLTTSPALGTAVAGMGTVESIAITPDGNTAWLADNSGKARPVNNLKNDPHIGNGRYRHDGQRPSRYRDYTYLCELDSARCHH